MIACRLPPASRLRRRARLTDDAREWPPDVREASVGLPLSLQCLAFGYQSSNTGSTGLNNRELRPFLRMGKALVLLKLRERPVDRAGMPEDAVLLGKRFVSSA
jgi:hypothetical protein